MITLEFAKTNDLRNYKRLFLSAFPPEERPPYLFMRWQLLRGKGDLLIAKENGAFVGFIHLICYKDLVYFFFFAVEEKARGKGYGTQIIQLIKEKYAGKRIFLAREPLDDGAENALQRRKRHEFYLKNGFIDLPGQITEGHYLFDAMGIGGEISPAEYDALIVNWGGRLIQKWADMRLIPRA